MNSGLANTGAAAPDLACARTAAIDALHAKTAIYTRDAVVEQLLDMVTWPASGRHLVDTSCGDGSFLGAALERLLMASPSIQDPELIDRIEGWEIHPRAATEARERIAQILCRHGRTITQAQAVACGMVRTGDFLTQAPSDQRYDTVVGNPPYLRMVHVPTALRSEYLATQPRHTHHDLLHSFLEKCAKSLRPGGEIAIVTSDRWLQNDTAARLRQSVGLTLGIGHLSRLDASSAFYRPKYRKAGTPPRVCPVAVVLRPHTHCEQALGALPVFAEQSPLVATTTRTLSTMATVELGPWLGTKGVFIVDADTAATLPATCLVPTLDSRDLAAGITVPRQYAIRTGSDRPDAPVLEHLERNAHRMCNRGRRNQPWLAPTNIDAFDLQSECIVVPRIADGLKAYPVQPGWLPINYNLVVRPREGYSVREVQAALETNSAQAWIRTRAHKLEGRYVQVTAKLLRQLPC